MARDSYSCIWGFQQSFFDSADATAVIKRDIYHIDSSSGVVKPGFGSTPSVDEYGYAVSGTNTHGPIYTSVSTIDSPGQQTLQNRASSNYNPSGFNDIWRQFPGRSAVANPDISVNKVRHPAEAWNTKYG